MATHPHIIIMSRAKQKDYLRNVHHWCSVWHELPPSTTCTLVTRHPSSVTGKVIMRHLRALVSHQT